MQTRKLIGNLCAVCIFAFPEMARATTETVLYSFANFPYGLNPYGTLARGASGNLYGTTYQGGEFSLGVVFEWSSSGYKILHSFKGGADGANPYAGVVIDPTGNLYGTTYDGGPANRGAVYKIATDATETVLYAFTGGADGSYPYAGVTLDSAGNVYGTTYQGGAANLGVVYKVGPTGQETVIHSFTGQPDGANPYGGVIFDPDGNLYGATPGAGAWTYGAIFKITPAGQETVLYSFAGGPSGGEPYSSLVRDSAGNFYGTANVPAAGLIYKITPSGAFQRLHEFGVTHAVETGLAVDAAGNLYGTTPSGGQAGLGGVYELTAAGQFQALYSFPGAPKPGNNGWVTGPTGAVTLDAAGNIYGTTPYGGLGGIIFELPTGGAETTLYTLAPAAGGTVASGPVTMDAAGNLYGTAAFGGSANWGILYQRATNGRQAPLLNFRYGGGGNLTLDSAGNLYGGINVVVPSGHEVGSIFRLSRSGQYTTLYTFPGGAYAADGDGTGWVIVDSAGNLYGAAAGGSRGDGLIFKLSSSGEYTVLHTFTGGADGLEPNSGLTPDRAGNLYGTTSGGGIGAGVVFKITPTGAFSVLYTFTAEADGGYPLFGVILDPSGNLYGTASGYGALGTGKFGSGVVFELDTAGAYNVLYTFTGGTDGGAPQSLARDRAGNLYGTTEFGGDSQCEADGLGCGVVFKLAPSGAFSVLHTFTGGADGSGPYAGPTLGPDGSLYGTTGFGGTANSGVLYKITP